MINQLFTTGDMVGHITAMHVFGNLMLTLVLIVAVSYMYRYTHKGFSYSQHFVSTLIIISMVTTMAMMVIGNSLAIAFGLLGAFSIIRFRTVVKEVRDTGFIFLTLVIGMAVGTNNYNIAIVSTVVMLFVIFILYYTNFGSIRNNDYLLMFSVDTENNPSENFVSIFKKYIKNSMLLNMSTKGTITEMVYSVRFKDVNLSDKIVKTLKKLEGVNSVSIVSSKSDTEY